MDGERPDDGVAPDAPTGPCRSCGAPTSAAQRYCLDCGALVGTRRLDPLEVLHRRAGPSPVPAAPAASRAIPVTAAAAAILVAGLAGSLVAGGGDGARAAVISRPAVAAVAAPATVPGTADDTQDASADSSASSSSSSDDATASTDATSEVADVATDDAAPVDPGTDTAPATDDPGDGETTPDDATIPPHVWLLALDGPRAQEAVDRVAEQGVRLTGVLPVAADTSSNATALLTGVLPSPPAAAGTVPPAAAAAPTPSLPELLSTAGQTWRSYLDAQPGTGDPLPGACTDPPAGDAAAAITASRTPFGRIPALRTDDACVKGTSSLETLGNDVSSGETLPSFSYATLGGCAPPDRTVVALPDQVSDAVTAITESTEYQEDGVVIVTAVGAADPCPAVPATSRQAAATAAPVPAPAATAVQDPAVAAAPGAALPPTPTVVLRADAKPGSTLGVSADLRALTRLTASTLGVDPPGTSGADDVPKLELPAAAKR